MKQPHPLSVLGVGFDGIEPYPDTYVIARGSVRKQLVPLLCATLGIIAATLLLDIHKAANILIILAIGLWGRYMLRLFGAHPLIILANVNTLWINKKRNGISWEDITDEGFDVSHTFGRGGVIFATKRIINLPKTNHRQKPVRIAQQSDEPEEKMQRTGRRRRIPNLYKKSPEEIAEELNYWLSVYHGMEEPPDPALTFERSTNQVADILATMQEQNSDNGKNASHK